MTEVPLGPPKPPKSPGPPVVRIDDHYQILQGRERQPCVLDLAEWDHLINHIETVKLPNQLWESSGSVLVGAGLSCVISFSIIVLSSDKNTVATAPWLELVIGLSCLIIGASLYAYGFKKRTECESSFGYVKKFVDFLKTSVRTSDDGANDTHNDSAEGTLASVSGPNSSE